MTSPRSGRIAAPSPDSKGQKSLIQARNSSRQNPHGLRAPAPLDAVAEDVAILDDDIALVDADPKFDAPIGRNRGATFGRRALHLGSAAQRIDDAGELDQQPVAGGLDDAAAVFMNPRVDQLGPNRLQSIKGPLLRTDRRE